MLISFSPINFIITDLSFHKSQLKQKKFGKTMSLQC